MSSSYGHAIVKMSETPERKPRGYGTNPETLTWRPWCQGRKCDEKPEFVTRYHYITGRAGRTTYRIQYACQKHGDAFAKKHGLELPK